MNREEIIRMAREAGFPEAILELSPIALERFAALVIANHPPQSFMTWQEGYEAGKQTEREACAKLLEQAAEAAKNADPQGFVWQAVKASVEVIRARGDA
jgi:hypothetical protein